VIIRTARIEDIEAIAALDSASFGGEAYPKFFLRQAVDLWGPFMRVAEANADVCGYALAAPAAESGAAWILSVAVARVARGRGIARAMLEPLLADLKTAGRTNVYLTVHPNNRAAITAYEALDFVAVDEVRAYFGPGEARLRMHLRL
jgi:[ribosomal protein S18]-alanine N-acetyltransferase